MPPDSLTPEDDDGLAPKPWSAEVDVAAWLAPFNGFLKHYVWWATGQTGAPAAYHVGSALALLAAVIPPSMGVPGLPGADDVPGNLFVLVVGRQGADHKSTAVTMARKLLQEAAPRKIDVEAGSDEGLVKSIASRKQQVIFHDDMGDFFRKTRERKDGGNYASAIKSKYLRLYDRDPIGRNLAGSRIEAKDHHVSVLGAINPSLAATEIPLSDWQNGLMSRFLVVWAQAERNVRSRAKDTLRDDLVEYLSAAAACNADLFGKCRGLTEKARLLWESWEWMLKRSSPPGVKATTIGPRTRAPIIAIRVALLMAFGEQVGWPTEKPGGGIRPGVDFLLGPREIMFGIRVATMGYEGACMLAAHAVNDEDMRRRRDVLLAIDPAGGMTPIGEITVEAQILLRDAKPILDTLMAEGMVRRSIRNAEGIGLQEHYALTPAGAGAIQSADADALAETYDTANSTSVLVGAEYSDDEGAETLHSSDDEAGSERADEAYPEQADDEEQIDRLLRQSATADAVLRIAREEAGVDADVDEEDADAAG